MGLFSRKQPVRVRTEPTLSVRNASDTPLIGMSELTGSESMFFGGSYSQTFGPPVSEQTSMAVSAVFRCVALISGLIAGLPLGVYRDDPELGRVEAKNHRLAPLLGRVPFPGRPLSSFAWRELWGVNFLLWGNHYSVIRYDQAARVVGFEPALPWQVEVHRQAGQNLYVVTWLDGRREVVRQDDMLHICGPGFDGIRAPSRIQSFARNSIALAKVLEEGTGMAHENGAKLSGMVELPPNVTPADKAKMEAYYADRAQGRANNGKLLYVDKDTKFTSMQLSPEDLATLESRRYQTADICRFFGVPPHLVGEAAGTSAWGSGIEQLTIGFLRFTLESDLQRIEHELNMKLLADGPYYVMFDREALSAMDATTEATTAATRIGSGQRTINETRRRQHLPAVPDGDTVLVNSTMIPLSRALNPPAPPLPAQVKPDAPP